MNDNELEEMFSEVDDRFLAEIAKCKTNKKDNKYLNNKDEEEEEGEDLSDFLRKDIHEGDIDEILISHLEDQGD